MSVKVYSFQMPVVRTFLVTFVSCAGTISIIWELLKMRNLSHPRPCILSSSSDVYACWVLRSRTPEFTSALLVHICIYRHPLSVVFLGRNLLGMGFGYLLSQELAWWASTGSFRCGCHLA